MIVERKGIMDASIDVNKTKEDGKTSWILADYTLESSENHGPTVMLTKNTETGDNESKSITLFDYLKNNPDGKPDYDDGLIGVYSKGKLKVIKIGKSELKEIGDKLFEEISSYYDKKERNKKINFIDADSDEGRVLKKKAPDDLLK